MAHKGVWIIFIISLFIALSMSACSDKDVSIDENISFMDYAASYSDATMEDEKIIITVLCSEYNSDLDRDILEFNKMQSRYYVVKVEYDGEEDYDKWLSLQFAAGNYPDIYEVSSGVGGMSVDECIKRDLFEDLSGYFEDDIEIEKEDFIPTVFEAMTRDGKLFFCSGDFLVQSIIARTSDVGELDGWTWNEMKSYIDRKDNEGSKAWIFNTNNKIATLNLILTGCGDDFIDWENKTCFFDSEEFINVLKLCNRDVGEEMEFNEFFFQSSDLVPAGEQLLEYVYLNPEVMIWEETLFDGDCCYVGFPDKDRRGTFISFNNALAISSKSSNKEGAWEFVRWRMTESYQGNRYLSSDAPSRLDVFDVYCDSKQAKEEYIDQYGNIVMPNAGAIRRGSLLVEHEDIPDNIINEYKGLIYNASGNEFNNKIILGIIDEEASSYFSGDKDIQDVVNIIQSRVMIYINEMN